MPFQRESNGEILPPANSLPEKPVVTGRKIRSAPKQKNWEIVTSLHRYQQYLLGILSGQAVDDPETATLYRAIMRGEPLSLYPAGMHGWSNQKSGVPILQRIGDDQWQVSTPDQEHRSVLTGDVVSVLYQRVGFNIK